MTNSLQLFEMEYGKDGEQMVSSFTEDTQADTGLKVKREDKRIISVSIKSRGNDPLSGPLIGIRGSGP